MPKVQLNTPAPDFTLEDFNQNTIQLSDFKGKKNVLLVFNRGFM
ncbi:MAG: redoxin domain-containing protein [Chloroflexi bacterium]|nr:redoxin domain-containing protein [Chloroflexota bacterium]